MGNIILSLYELLLYVGRGCDCDLRRRRRRGRRRIRDARSKVGRAESTPLNADGRAAGAADRQKSEKTAFAARSCGAPYTARNTERLRTRRPRLRRRPSSSYVTCPTAAACRRDSSGALCCGGVLVAPRLRVVVDIGRTDRARSLNDHRRSTTARTGKRYKRARILLLLVGRRGFWIARVVCFFYVMILLVILS